MHCQFNIQKLIKAIHNINRTQNKTHIVISINAKKKKCLSKSSSSVIKKGKKTHKKQNLNKLGVERTASM